MKQVTVRRTADRSVVVVSCPGSSRYTYVCRMGRGFTVGGSTPFASPVQAAKFARRLMLRFVEAPQFATEPTPEGNQYVIPGCEKDKSRGPSQMDLF